MSMLHCLSCLVRALELVQEACVILREHAQVFHLILQVGDTFYAHAEGVALVNGAVDAVGIQHSGVYHSTAKNLYPSRVFAERTALSSA